MPQDHKLEPLFPSLPALPLNSPSVQEEPGNVGAAVGAGDHEGSLVVLVPAVHRHARGQGCLQRLQVAMADGLILLHVLALWGEGRV